MLRVKSKVTSNRRAVTLRPKDYDHEIDLVDHDGSASRAQNRQSADDTIEVSRSSTNAELLQQGNGGTTTDEDCTTDSPQSNRTNNRPRDDTRRLSNQREHEGGPPHDALRPTISVQEASPGVFRENNANVVPKKPRIERETVIDILYENERGGFLCGAALFSAAALGGLDATPWTNAYHNPSPTSIHTATVPDPSWEWVWPEWRINHQDEMDEGGWEYSFAYSKKFSWHGPKWWSSFVRRRAWIRKRAKKSEEDISADMHLLNADYFLIQPASTKQSYGSLASSKSASKAPSLSQVSSVSGEPFVLPDIQDMETLTRFLRKGRIDREKLEAVENYLENGLDLEQLTEEMHNIMRIFVFQASRRLLLSHLMHIYDSATEELEKKSENDEGLESRREALRKAIKHADEEVRKLAYWSDVKQMAEDGETGVMEERKGWDDEEWEGLDQSGPGEPMKGKLP